MQFYMTYISKWPEYIRVCNNIGGNLVGYCIGKSEGIKNEWHGHVSVLTVTPNNRRIGIARQLLNDFEYITNIKKAYFVDLFVRESNINAIKFYENVGYSIYRRVIQYYRHSGKKEDALDMRKCMDIDKNKKSLICHKKTIKPNEIIWKTS